MRLIILLALTGCIEQVTEQVTEQIAYTADLEQCAFSTNERECLLAQLEPGRCYRTKYGHAGNVCFPKVTQWEIAEDLAEVFCLDAPPEQWWCASEAVFNWCGGGKVEHCTEIIQDGVLLDRCMTNIEPGALPAGCEELFQ